MVSVTVGCQPTGSDPYLWAKALARVVGKYAGMQASVVAYDTASVLPGLFHQAKLDFGVINTIMTYNSARGLDAWTGKRYADCRFVVSLANAGLLTFASRDSGVKSMIDIKGKRFMCAYVGSPCAKTIVGTLLDACSLSETDLTVVPYRQPMEIVHAMRERLVDAALYPVTRATPFLMELAATTHLNFVSLDKATIRKLCVEASVLPMTVPAGSYPRQCQEWKGAGPHEIIAARASLGEDLVYAVASAAYDHFSEYLGYAPTLEESRLPAGLDPAWLTVPVHAGAVKYYTDRGWWTEAHQERQTSILAELGLEK